MIHAHLNYGIILWGNSKRHLIDKLNKLQKRAIRCIYKKPYSYPSNRLFKQAKILKIEDMYKLENLKFMFRYYTKLLPKHLQSFFTINSNIHQYQTRHNDQIHLETINSSLFQQSFMHQSPLLWRNIPVNIRGQSLKSITDWYKQEALTGYL